MVQDIGSNDVQRGAAQQFVAMPHAKQGDRGLVGKHKPISRRHKNRQRRPLHQFAITLFALSQGRGFARQVTERVKGASGHIDALRQTKFGHVGLNHASTIGIARKPALGKAHTGQAAIQTGRQPATLC